MHRPRAKGRLNPIKRCEKNVGQKVHGSLRKDVQQTPVLFSTVGAKRNYQLLHFHVTSRDVRRG
jgi:hypothetical protein